MESDPVDVPLHQVVVIQVPLTPQLVYSIARCEEELVAIRLEVRGHLDMKQEVTQSTRFMSMELA